MLKNIILLFTIVLCFTASAGQLQNEDFKTEAELISAGGSKAQLLNDTKVYVTADGINESLDDAISLGLLGFQSPLTTDGDLLYFISGSHQRIPVGNDDQVLTVVSGVPTWQDASGGGGGSAGINFVVDPSFEKNDLAFTNSLSGTTTYPLYTANDKLYSEFNEVYFQIAHTGLSAANYSTSYTVTRTGLDGKQGLVSIWAKTAAELDLCVDVDTNGCDTTLTLINDDTWRKYEVPIVFGSGNVLIKFVNASITGDVTLQLDNVYVGTMPDGYIQDVGQAHFVGSQYTESTNCVWSRTSDSWGIPSPDNDCAYTNTGKTSKPDTNTPSIKITNARTDGYYRVSSTALLYVITTGKSCAFTLSSGNDFENKELLQADQAENRRAYTLTSDFRFNNAGDKTISLLTRGFDASTACGIYANGVQDRNLSFSVHFFPDDSSTVVTQDTELTAKTANEFVANVSSTGVVSGENFDWIDGDCSGGTSVTCTFNAGIFSSTPICQITAIEAGGAARIATIKSTSTSQIAFDNFLTSGTVSATPKNIKCTRSTDYNKSATIVGKFENINSSDLCTVEARNNDGTVLTGGLVDNIKFNKVNDNCNAWDGEVFTAPKNGYYHIHGGIAVDTSVNLLTYSKVNGTLKNLVTDNLSLTVGKFNDAVFLSEGDTYSLTPNSTQDMRTTPFEHYIVIQELPDYEAIVKNLSNQKTKCQTKYLSANVTATGWISDLQFSNLTIGKKYKITFQVAGNIGSGSAADFRYYNDNNSLNNLVSRWYHEDVYNINTSMAKFVSLTNYLSAYFVETGTSTIAGANNRLTTFAELCELPDTYVETTEF